MDLQGRWNDKLGPVAEFVGGELRLLPDAIIVDSFALWQAVWAIGVRCLISFVFCGEEWCGILRQIDEEWRGGHIMWHTGEEWYQTCTDLNELKGTSARKFHRI